MEQLIRLAMQNVDKKILIENLLKCKFDKEIYARLVTGIPTVTADDIYNYLKLNYADPTIVNIENSNRFTDIFCIKVTFKYIILMYGNVEHTDPFNSMKEFKEFEQNQNPNTGSIESGNCPYKYVIKCEDYNYYSPEQILSIK